MFRAWQRLPVECDGQYGLFLADRFEDEIDAFVAALAPHFPRKLALEMTDKALFNWRESVSHHSRNNRPGGRT